MGFGSFTSNAWRKINGKLQGTHAFYKDFVQGTKMGYGMLRAPVDYMYKGAHWFDDLISHATGIPVVDDLMSLVKDEPIYSEALGFIDSTKNSLDDLGRIGSDVNDLIEKYVYRYNNPSAHQGGSFFNNPVDLSKVQLQVGGQFVSPTTPGGSMTPAPPGVSPPAELTRQAAA